MARLTHVDDQDRAAMVDVATKRSTTRTAVAEGRVVLGAKAFRALRDHRLAKGDAITVARIAGIQAAKRTADWIPLCHGIALEHVAVSAELLDDSRTVRVVATATARARTGVEMEALTAVTAACLALYDMTKGLDRGSSIEGVRLLSKRGGRSGSWTRRTV